MGPTGAGKSQLASRIFDLKKSTWTRKRRLCFGQLRCLRGDNAMSALFGHVKGAYTGADKPRDGLLKTADGGCLFPDEIGELGLDEQAMLLSAIETGCYMPLGSIKKSAVISS